MLKRIFSVGLLAGLVSGLLVAICLHFVTTPLILTAEVYEEAAEAAHHAHEQTASHEHHHDAGSEHSHELPEWKPADGIERTLSTSAATIVTGIGFSLVLVALMLAADEPITPKNALLWSACGFIATGLATGLGLAPELPGSAGADLAARQTWWIATAAVTGLGLYLLIKTASLATRTAGLVLIALPHIIGAPHPKAFISTAPAELAAQFAASSLVIHALLWVFVGLSVGTFWIRGASHEGATP